MHSQLAQAEATLYPQTIKFQHILENKEIVLGEVRGILQDSDGFMWLGGWNALVRYDGTQFKQIDLEVNEGGETVKAPLTNTIHIFEDSRNRLWFSTTKGVAYYDKEVDLLRKIPNSPDQTVKITESFVNQMAELPNGKLLAISYDGFYIIDPETLKYQSFSADPEDPLHPNKPAHNSIKALYITPEKEIWFGGIAGLETYDWKTGELKHIALDKKSDASIDNEVRAIAPNGDGKLWLATPNGVVLFEPGKGVVQRFTHDAQDPNSLVTSNVWGVMRDSKGRLWLALDQGGVALYQAEKNRFISYKNNPSKATSLTSNIVRTIFEDNTGDIWIGMYPQGIDFFDQSSTAILHYANDVADASSLSNNSVLTVSEDRDGNLWLGTEIGLNFLNRKTNSFTRYSHEKDDPKTLAANAVLSSLIDSNNILWVGHWNGGVTRMDIRTREITRIPFNFPEERITQSDKLNSGHVWSIYEDRNKDLWFATHTGGLSQYDRKTKQFTHYWPSDVDNQHIASEWVWTIFEDSRGNFWVGTSNGLDLMDRTTGTFTHFKPDENDPNSISDAYAITIHEDKKGRLWIGTNLGINQYHYDTQSFTRVTSKDGLNDDNIRKILEDKDGTLWLGTANGVSSYNPENGKIKNYTRDGGKLVGGFNFDSGVMTQANEVILGGINGLRVYKPDELVENPNVPPVVFTELKIFSDVIQVNGKDGILNKDINYTDTLVLDYHQNMFILDYAALNFRDSEKNQYQYKLEGFDQNWIRAGTGKSAKYTNLDPGTYTFTVRGSNNDGVWNDEGKSITIVQLPPPWLTWWAYTLYVLAAIALLLLIVGHQRKKRKAVEVLNKILEEKVTERTLELSQKNSDIQAMLSNMRQGLFTIKPGGEIHQEYSRFLEEIFETSEIAERDFIDLLFTNADLSNEVITQIKEVTAASLGEEEMFFEFNSHLLIDEYSVDINGHRKTLSLDWNCIAANDIVKKIMVSVRDVTRLKQMEQESMTQRRELDIIGQLLNVSSKKFLSLEKSIIKFCEQNRQKIERTETPSEETVAYLFRNMHTIKGNCRTYGFSYLSEVAHNAEDSYTQQSKTSEWNSELLTQDIARVEAVLQEYSAVYRRVIRMSESVVKVTDGELAVNEGALKHSHTEEDAAIPEILSDIVNALSSIAEQLGKPAPDVTFNVNDIRLKSEAHEVITNVFSHLLRNSIDHGIESPEERLRRDKPAAGHIDIAGQVKDKVFELHLKDDGRGLNLLALEKIGRQRKLWDEDFTPSKQEVANTIFTSGVSSAEAVTDISGRGVGMEAVKAYLGEIGGGISIQLGDSQDKEHSFVSFTVVVSLPNTLLSPVIENAKSL
ncbi:Chemotaxis protein CheA [Thalassocella blandensis]|nr:Chemotaxis protein CheA [Thalassocella blandensis]